MKLGCTIRVFDYVFFFDRGRIPEIDICETPPDPVSKGTSLLRSDALGETATVVQ